MVINQQKLSSLWPFGKWVLATIAASLVSHVCDYLLGGATNAAILRGLTGFPAPLVEIYERLAANWLAIPWAVLGVEIMFFVWFRFHTSARRPQPANRLRTHRRGRKTATAEPGPAPIQPISVPAPSLKRMFDSLRITPPAFVSDGIRWVYLGEEKSGEPKFRLECPEHQFELMYLDGPPLTGRIRPAFGGDTISGFFGDHLVCTRGERHRAGPKLGGSNTLYEARLIAIKRLEKLRRDGYA